MGFIRRPDQDPIASEFGKSLFWGWLAFLFVLNVIPLGNEVNRSLSGHKFIFRLDYLVHLVSFAAYAGIFLYAKHKMLTVFRGQELLKFSAVVLSAAGLFESIQLGLPYRTFNPWDLVSNLAGAFIGIVIIVYYMRHQQAKLDRHGS